MFSDKLNVVSAEYKIQYIVSPGVQKQQYDVCLHLFFSTELEPAEIPFYRSLFEVVRLHTHKVGVLCQLQAIPDCSL